MKSIALIAVVSTLVSQALVTNAAPAAKLDKRFLGFGGNRNGGSRDYLSGSSGNAGGQGMGPTGMGANSQSMRGNQMNGGFNPQANGRMGPQSYGMNQGMGMNQMNGGGFNSQMNGGFNPQSRMGPQAYGMNQGGMGMNQMYGPQMRGRSFKRELKKPATHEDVLKKRFWPTDMWYGHGQNRAASYGMPLNGYVGPQLGGGFPNYGNGYY